MDESRRHADAWAAQWRIRRRNRLIAIVAAAVIALIAAISLVSYLSTHVGRMTFSSEEEMKEFVQGRYAIESSYMDVIIEGDTITKTYLSYSHYDRSYAERYGYDYEEDHVYTDIIVKYDYKHGVLKTELAEDYIIDSDGNLQVGKYTTYYKTTRPRPEPIDPATLNNPEGSADVELPEATEESVEERDESLEEAAETEAAAIAAGIISGDESEGE